MASDDPHGLNLRQRAGPPHDPWHRFAGKTPARIAIGRSGSSLPTREVLAFSLAHARARDAVHATFDRDGLLEPLRELGLAPVMAESRAPDRPHYLRRPDLGRQLDDPSRARLQAVSSPAGCDLALVIADGLSATAVATNAVATVAALVPHIERLGMTVGPLVLARGARVALGDHIGAVLGAQLVVVLIGERPGLSAPDSMSAYLTYQPDSRRTDADRNCISNIRDGGLAPARAAATLAWLIEQAKRLRQTGVALKDESVDDAKLAP